LRELIDFLRRVVVSPEFLVVVLAVWVLFAEPQWLGSVTKILAGAPEGVKYLSLVPVAVAAWSLQQSKAILFPAEDIKGILQQWPKFQKLKERVIIGILFQAVFCTLGVGAWIISPSLSNGTAVIVMGMSIAGALVGASTFYLAGIMSAEITKRHATKI